MERRLDVRVLYECPINIKVQKGNHEVKTTTWDIGTGGLGVKLSESEELESGAHVFIELFLRKEQVPICSKATIVWASKTIYKKTRQPECRIGISFDNISDEDLQRIANFIIVLVSKNVLGVAHDLKSSLAAISTCLDTVLSGVYILHQFYS